MDVTGRMLEKTNNGHPFVGTELCTFDTSSVTRWGQLVSYGDNRTFIIAEVYGTTVAVILSSLSKEVKKEFTALRKLIKFSGLDASKIRSARVSGIIWNTADHVHMP